MNLTKGLARRRQPGAIDITPLVDVVFILLIFLLVSTTFKTRENAFSIVLPVGDQKSRVTKVKRPTVFVTRTGQYIFYTQGEDPSQPVSGTRHVSLRELSRAISGLVDESGANVSVSIKGDAGANYQNIMDVVNECYRHGIERVYFPYKSSEGQ